MNQLPAAVERFANSQYKCPSVRRDWLRKFTLDLEKKYIFPPEGPDDDQTFIEELKSTLLNSRLSDVMKPGSGLPPTIGLPSMHTVLFDIVLEVVHLMDFGVSPFALEETRIARDQIMLQHFSFASKSGVLPKPSDVGEWERNLPQYPGNHSVVYLSDGVTELEGRVYKPCGMVLGHTSIGLKVRLVGVPVIGGIAYLEPENIVVMGGRVESRQDEHAARLRSDIRRRMQTHIELAKQQGTEADSDSMYGWNPTH